MRSNKPYIFEKPLGKCLHSSKRGLIHLFLYPPCKQILIHPFLVQITHGLLTLLDAKMSKFGEESDLPFIFESPILGISLKAKISDPPLSPFSGKLIPTLKKGV